MNDPNDQAPQYFRPGSEDPNARRTPFGSPVPEAGSFWSTPIARIVVVVIVVGVASAIAAFVFGDRKRAEQVAEAPPPAKKQLSPCELRVKSFEENAAHYIAMKDLPAATRTPRIEGACAVFHDGLDRIGYGQANMFSWSLSGVISSNKGDCMVPDPGATASIIVVTWETKLYGEYHDREATHSVKILKPIATVYFIDQPSQTVLAKKVFTSGAPPKELEGWRYSKEQIVGYPEVDGAVSKYITSLPRS